MNIEETNLVDTVLADKILRIQNHVTDTIREHGSISDFKEDVLYVIHFLLERQLSPKNLTATEIVARNMGYEINRMQRERDEENIRTLRAELEKKDKIIDEMAEHIVSSAIVDDTVCSIKCDCETDILEDCTYEKMLSCTKQYFAKKVEGK